MPVDNLEVLWSQAVDMEDFVEAERIVELRAKMSTDLGPRSVTMCSYDERDPISGKRCILLEEPHGPHHRVDTPLLDSPDWELPHWKAYESVFGRHVTKTD